jgi:hypothetical protein
MKQVTRNIDPDAARDLLQRVPRACIAFGNDDGPQAQPVILCWREPQYLIGIPPSAVHRPNPGQEVVLLVDEGIYYFDLRAIYIRGIIQPAPQTFDATPGYYAWFEIIPSKTIAWDYGTMHEVDDEHQ